MTEWLDRDHISTVKSPTYWDAANVKLERLTIYSMDDQSANANYYLYGDCDALASNNIPASYLPLLNGERAGPYADYYAAPYLGIYDYLINTQKFPNRHFRRALSFALDRRPIPGFIHGGQRPSAQIMPGIGIDRLSDADLAVCGVRRRAAAPPGGDPACPGWFEEVATGEAFCGTQRVASMMIPGQLCYLPPPGLDYDPERARAELAEARKEMGARFPRSFTLKFNAGSEGHKLIAEYVQDQWRKVLGLDVDLQVQEWKTFLADTNNGQYDVARMGWILNFPDVEAEMLPQFKCDAPDNREKYCNPEFDALFRKAEATFDRKQRLAIMREAERILVEDQPIIPFYVYTQQHLQKPYVRDLAMNFVDQVPFEKAWIDPDWRAHLTGGTLQSQTEVQR